MTVSNVQIIDKMIHELREARELGGKDAELAMKISKVQVMCELLLTGQEVGAQVEKLTPQVQVPQLDVATVTEDNREDAMGSIFDF